MLFLLYKLRNGLEWVNNTGTLIPKTSEVYFLLCWASRRHFVNFFCEAATYQNFLIFWEQTQLIEIYPKILLVQIDELGPSLYVKRVL